MIYLSRSEAETEDIGRRLAAACVPGSVFCLTGELGAGKTVFARGFARGLCVGGDITSPTFCLLNEYTEGRLPLYHFDVYRLEGEEEMTDLCYPDYFFGGGACLIEWAGNIKGVIPEDAVWVHIRKTGDETREITVTDGEGLL